jgi:hypothetical protein
MATNPNPPPAGAAAPVPETIAKSPGFLIAGRLVTPLTPRAPAAGAA